MALEVKELDCPPCGASLSAKNARQAKLLVCHNCGSQIDLTSPEHEIIGKAILGSAPPKSPIRLGQIATFDGVKWQVVGRVRYYDEGHWDEWLLMSEAGKYQWLVEDDLEFTLYQPLVPTKPVDPNQVGSHVDLEGVKARVTDRGQAAIKYVEGELTWKARVGDEMNYLDAEHYGGVYSIEWSEHEIEFFKGRDISKRTVYRAFGFALPSRPRRTWQSTRPARSFYRPTDEGIPSNKTVSTALLVILVVLFILCVMAGIIPVGTGSDSSSSGYSPSIRTGSSGSSGGGSFGSGGSSGGK